MMMRTENLLGDIADDSFGFVGKEKNADKNIAKL